MTIDTKLKLLSGGSIPQFGFGTWQLEKDDVKPAIQGALNAGYKMIDTAQIYNNEYEIGQAIQGYDRSQIFITSKVWPVNFKYYTLRSIKESLRRLNVDYIDLMLLHWPYRENWEVTRKAYQALQEARNLKLVRAIGVSNYNVNDLEKLHQLTGEWPEVNQILLTPGNQQQKVVAFCQDHNIVVKGYSILKLIIGKGSEHFQVSGKITQSEKDYFTNLANKYQKTPAQIVLRWALQLNVVVFPKSRNSERIKENADLYDFSLSSEEMETIRKMDKDNTKEYVGTFIKELGYDFDKGLLFDKHF